MYINKDLFDECFCPCEGIGRICLRGDREIPAELEQFGQEVDGENYMASCFAIELVKGGAGIWYAAEHDWVDTGYTCDNYEEALAYYKNNATKTDLEETFAEWGN